MSLCLPVCLFVSYLPACLSVTCLYACLSVSLLSVCLTFSLSAYMLGVGEKIDPAMHRDSLANDSGSILRISESILSLVFFLLSTIFYFIFSHTTQHNIQNTTKQNNRHILNISRSNQKGGGEGRTTRTQKLLLYIITYIQQKTPPSINGRRPSPTNSRRCTFT